MSGKKSRIARKQMSRHRFPEVIDKTTSVEIDHYRRIGRLARSEQITIDEAVRRYVQRNGLMTKPKGI